MIHDRMCLQRQMTENRLEIYTDHLLQISEQIRSGNVSDSDYNTH